MGMHQLSVFSRIRGALCVCTLRAFDFMAFEHEHDEAMLKAAVFSVLKLHDKGATCLPLLPEANRNGEVFVEAKVRQRAVLLGRKQLATNAAAPPVREVKMQQYPTQWMAEVARAWPSSLAPRVPGVDLWTSVHGLANDGARNRVQACGGQASNRGVGPVRACLAEASRQPLDNCPPCRSSGIGWRRPNAAHSRKSNHLCLI